MAADGGRCRRRCRRMAAKVGRDSMEGSVSRQNERWILILSNSVITNPFFFAHFLPAPSFFFARFLPAPSFFARFLPAAPAQK
jgi:hypothetical protein